MRIGIFGGTFNPPHLGHLNSLQLVQKKVGLQKVYVVPASHNPLKIELEGPTPEQRLEMTRLALQGWGENFVVDDQEIQRGGKSFTIDTVKNISKKETGNELFLIIGLDNFEGFDRWKKFADILENCSLIVTSRPGFEFPQSLEELPEKLRDLVADFDFNYIELKSGKSIQFVRLEDIDASSTQLRKWLRVGKNVEKYIPLSVEQYVKSHDVYKGKGLKVTSYEKFTQFCADELFSKKAIQVRAFDLRKLSAPSEYALIASGTSSKHTTSLAENLIRSVKEEFNLLPQSIEGTVEGRWVVVDYGSLIVHVFYDFVRQEYSLEKLWQTAAEMPLKETTPTAE